MSEFYDYNPLQRYSRRQTPMMALVLVAIFSAMIGGVAGAYLAPTYIFGRLLPYPGGASHNPSYTLPPLQGEGTTIDMLAAGAAVQVSQRVGPAVVGVVNRTRVSSPFGSYQQESTGSGIIFDKTGLIVTNQHVVENATEIYIVLSDTIQVKAQLLGSDKRTDLAVVKINPMDLPPGRRDLSVVKFGDSSQIVQGELAIAIGNPLGMQFQRTVTAGIISAVERTLTLEDLTYKVIQTDAAINSGNSGGALVNSRGEVIGINQAKIGITGVEGMGFAIPVNVARPIIEDLVRHGKVIRPWLGIQGVALTPASAQQYGVTITQGIYIDIVADSPAQRAGLRRGDVITKYNGVELTTFDQLIELLNATGVNGTANLEVRRGNSTLTINVKLEVAP
ncbi:MAG: serine protease Do [Bacillota bacterium]|nr:MAG: serine protease Do [Bacillota bacterium]MBS3949201.1 trypsin-like peptidase domain-containing protein [Peptococcaceae bacterium]